MAQMHCDVCWDVRELVAYQIETHQRGDWCERGLLGLGLVHTRRTHADVSRIIGGSSLRMSIEVRNVNLRLIGRLQDTDDQ